MACKDGLEKAVKDLEPSGRALPSNQSFFGSIYILELTHLWSYALLFLSKYTLGTEMFAQGGLDLE